MSKLENSHSLAGLAAKVYLIVRKPYLRASKIMQERVMKHEHFDLVQKIIDSDSFRNDIFSSICNHRRYLCRERNR